MPLQARRIESWDLYVTRGDFFQIMIKMKMDVELAEILQRNNYKLRVAVNDADPRYCGVYYAVAEFPSYNDPCNPVVYLVLWDVWRGYPYEKGYLTILGQEQFPGHVNNWQSEVKQATKCGPFLDSYRPSNLTFGGRKGTTVPCAGPKPCCVGCPQTK